MQMVYQRFKKQKSDSEAFEPHKRLAYSCKGFDLS